MKNVFLPLLDTIESPSICKNRKNPYISRVLGVYTSRKPRGRIVIVEKTIQIPNGGFLYG